MEELKVEIASGKKSIEDAAKSYVQGQLAEERYYSYKDRMDGYVMGLERAILLLEKKVEGVRCAEGIND